MLHELNGQASLRLREISTLLIQEGNLDALYERVLDAAVYLMRADAPSRFTIARPNPKPPRSAPSVP